MYSVSQPLLKIFLQTAILFSCCVITLKTYLSFKVLFKPDLLSLGYYGNFGPQSLPTLVLVLNTNWIDDWILVSQQSLQVPWKFSSHPTIKYFMMLNTPWNIILFYNNQQNRGKNRSVQNTYIADVFWLIGPLSFSETTTKSRKSMFLLNYKKGIFGNGTYAEFNVLYFLFDGAVRFLSLHQTYFARECQWIVMYASLPYYLMLFKKN